MRREEAEELREALLASARASFREFYSRASVTDASCLDSLVLAHTALSTLIEAPRDRLPSDIRVQVDRATDSVEQVFTGFRERLRACPTFLYVAAEERRKIEDVVIRVALPAE